MQVLSFYIHKYIRFLYIQIKPLYPYYMYAHYCLITTYQIPISLFTTVIKINILYNSVHIVIKYNEKAKKYIMIK